MTKSGSESSISEACDSNKELQPCETKDSKEQIERVNSTEKDDPTKVVRKEVLEIPMTNMSKRGSLTSAKSLHEFKREAMIDEPSGNQDSKCDGNDGKNIGDETSTNTKGIRPSKSETSIIDSFVVVENENCKKKNHANVLRDGMYQTLSTRSIYL